MISSEQIIAIVFRLLNFGVLIGLCTYIYKKYLKDVLISKIAEKLRQFKGLGQERDSLARQYRRLSKTVKAEQDEYKQLEQTVKQWSSAVEQEQARRTFEKNDRKRILKEKAAIRVEQVRAQKLKQWIMPHVLEDAQAQLQQLFDSKTMGKRFIQHIVKHMQKGES